MAAGSEERDMVITELYIRNFGKFSNRHFFLRDGVQVISGENEFGKTTLHAFIRAMLFGLERGRGRAAAKDDFSRYEPWEDPGSYAGVMRFVCGGRRFRLERNFARHTRSVSLVCEDDGEELSIEHGDLEMLLGGMTPELFDSTVSVGQLKAEPGQDLADALANYAANYYETGGGEYDLNAAMKALNEKKRTTVKQLREEEALYETKLRKMQQECGYLERDMERLDREYQEKEEALEGLEQEESLEPDVPVSGRPLIWSGIGGVCIGILGVLWCKTAGQELLNMPAFVGAAAGLVGLLGVIALTAGIMRMTRWSRRQSGTRTDGKDTKGRGTPDGTADQRKRLEWELGRIRGERKEKETRKENIREEYEETEKSERQIRLEKQCRALELAEETLKKAAGAAGEYMERRMNRRASEIFSAITDGKYPSLEIDRQRGITVWNGIRRIPAERLSRGTVEQIYFAVRMAAAEVMEEESIPVILDDVFAFYDDKRLECVLKWLSRQKKQVIIFTCQKREEEILREMEERRVSDEDKFA